MGENMTAFHWLLGWWFVLTLGFGACLAGAMMGKDVAKWRARRNHG